MDNSETQNHLAQDTEIKEVKQKTENQGKTMSNTEPSKLVLKWKCSSYFL